MAYRYRDNDTGQFVSRDTWETSHGRGGDYTRETYQPESGEPAPKEPEPEEIDYATEDDLIDYGDPDDGDEY